MKQFSLAIFAGGKSTRMGQDKAFLPWQAGKKTTFLEHMWRELNTLGPTYISMSAEQAEMLSMYKYPLLCDLRLSCGPLGALETVLTEVQTEWCFCCAVDMPNLSAELVAYLSEFCASDYDCVCLTVDGMQEPLCALYRKTSLSIVQEQLDKQEYSLRKLLAKLRTKNVALERSCFSKSCVVNVNTQEEYQTYTKQPRIFCVSGVKHSGKTTLICGLLPLFIKSGYRVSVIKHDGHDFRMDYPGTDTARFTEIGASQSIIYSERQYAILGCVEQLESLLPKLLAACRESDFIIIEGLKNSPYPKLEVVRQAVSSVPVCAQAPLLGLVTDVPALQQDKLPCFGLTEYERIFAYLVKNFSSSLSDISKKADLKGCAL